MSFSFSTFTPFCLFPFPFPSPSSLFTISLLFSLPILCFPYFLFPSPLFSFSLPLFSSLRVFLPLYFILYHIIPCLTTSFNFHREPHFLYHLVIILSNPVLLLPYLYFLPFYHFLHYSSPSNRHIHLFYSPLRIPYLSSLILLLFLTHVPIIIFTYFCPPSSHSHAINHPSYHPHPILSPVHLNSSIHPIFSSSRLPYLHTFPYPLSPVSTNTHSPVCSSQAARVS